MLQNIFINNVEIARANLIFDKYYDFKISRGPVYDYMKSFKPAASFDFSKKGENDTDGKVFSNVLWEGSRNDGILLKHIGLTGYDNGFKVFPDGNVSDEEIYDAFENDTEELTKGSVYDLFFMTEVFDNTFREDKPISQEEGYKAFKGGFYQGFFKIEDMCYQTLPIKIEDQIRMSISFRPRKDYGEGASLQNIFYVGTRAENKFAVFYNNGFKESKNGYFQELITEDYLEENPYELIGPDRSLSDMTTEDGLELLRNDREAVTTGNKFIFFNETEDGFNAETWKEGDSVKLVMDKARPSENLYPLMHYGEGGLTVDDIEEREKVSDAGYDVNKDITSNAFSIFITDEGEIGYRYLVHTCDNDHRVEVKEERSNKGLVKEDEWNDVDVIFNHVREGVMQVMIYVGGFLVLVSEMLPELDLRGLNDSSEKQETVPYNISVGGGTDGLKNAIYPSEYTLDEMDYLLEKNFSDPFFGDIRSFNIMEKYSDDGKQIEEGK